MTLDFICPFTISQLESRTEFGWFSIDYRMAPEYQAPQAAGDMAAKYRVDPNKLVPAGESASGFIVAYAGVHAKGNTRPRAVGILDRPNDRRKILRRMVLQNEKRRVQAPARSSFWDSGPGCSQA